MTRVVAAVELAAAVLVAAITIAVAGVAAGWLAGRYVLVPFHDPHHLAHWPIVATTAALTLTVAMALTSHHRSTR